MFFAALADLKLKLMPRVVGVSRQNGQRTIDLLSQHDTGELVRQGDAA
jgi:hypothetical protein